MSPPPTARVALGLAAGAVVAAVGALVGGEYEFAGLIPFVVAALVGAAVGESVSRAAGAGGPVQACGAAALAGVAVAWAAWIDSGEGLEPFPAIAWPAVVVAAALAAWRAGRVGRSTAAGG